MAKADQNPLQAHVPTIGGLAQAIGADAGHFADVPLAGFESDSRKVWQGYAFFAMPGTKVDGAQFIAKAVEAGAVAVIGTGARPANLDRMVCHLQISDPRRALSRAAAYFYPAQPQTIVAVTGTAGKTSVADFTRQIFARLGRRAASLGTLGLVGPEGAHYGALTTPDPITLHRTLDELARDGVTHLAMEASSHGLDQSRLDGVKLAAAGFTNLGRDHLDYHPTMDAYFNAKLKLFEHLLPKDGVAVVNLDGARGAEAAVAAGIAGRRVMTIGRRGEDVALMEVAPNGFGQDVAIRRGNRDYRFRLPLMGAFQVENALLAAGLALATGEKPKGVFGALEHLTGVSGRLDCVGVFNGAPVFVDYAHKPEALQYALAALRPYASGKLVVVIGCGGDRDPGKRPIMGKIADEGADIAIITDDNPRSENPATIRAAMLAAAPDAIEIGDRAEAIWHAIGLLQPGDALLIAGKGHETGQIIGSDVLPFSDHQVARAAIEGLK